MDKFSLLPFSIGCVSHSSIDVIENQPSIKTQRESASSSPPSVEVATRLKTMSSVELGHIPKSNLGEKLHKLGKSIKSLVNKEENDDKVVEMEIGFPTDVQHVGHIGWDNDSDCVSTINTWERVPEFMSFPSLSI